MQKLIIALLALVPLCAYAQQGSMSAIPDCSLGYCSGLGVPGFSCNRGQRYVQVDNPGVNYSCTGIPSHWVQDAGGGGSSVSLTTTGTSGPATLTGSVLNIPQYQGVLTLTTTGSSGAATLTGSTLNIPNYATGGGSMVYPGVGIPNSTGSAWATPIFYVDANSPSSCTVNSVAYTTAFDCAFANAKAWISSGADAGQYNATLLVGSNGLLTTNVGIQEPTASGNHGTVNVIGDGVGASVLKLNTSLASGLCMVTQPPEGTALNYATVALSGLTLDANSNADCIMQINGVKDGSIAHILGKNVRGGSGNIGFQFGPSSATTSTVFETFVDDVKLDGLGGGYNPAIISCTVSSGNPVCTISDAGSYPSGTFAVQVHGVGNGSGPCSVYPTWTTTGTTTLTGLTASGGTCVAPLYVSVTPAPKVDYNFLFGPGFTDSTAKDIRAVEASAFAGIKITGHPNTFIHPHCFVGQYACVEDYGSSDFYGLESDSIGGYAAIVEGTGSRFTGLSQIYNNFQRYAGSSLIYVDQAAATNIGVTVSGVGCNGNRQNQGGYHNLVIGTGLPYTNTSSAGGAQDAGYAVPAGVQMDNVLNCSSSPTVNTVISHIGIWGSTGAVSVGLTPPTACNPATGCYAANEGSTAATPTTSQCYMRADSTTHTWRWSCNGTAEASMGVGAGGIANTTFTNATTAIGANACSASAATVTMTGLAITSVVMITPSTDTSGSTGWGAFGGLVIDAWPSAANTMSYKICNQSGAIITPGAITWNAGAR